MPCATPGRLAPCLLQEAIAAAAAAACGVREALQEDVDMALKGRRWGHSASMALATRSPTWQWKM